MHNSSACCAHTSMGEDCCCSGAFLEFEPLAIASSLTSDTRGRLSVPSCGSGVSACTQAHAEEVE